MSTESLDGVDGREDELPRILATLRRGEGVDHKQLQTLVAQLETANKELDAFSYSVSHDLRAPLRAIDGFSRILLEQEYARLGPDGQRYLRLISKNTRDMGALIDGLLTFSRLGQQALSKRSVRGERVAQQAVMQFEAERAGRAVEVRVEELPEVIADPDLLRQVFVNLLSNALKYTRTREAARIEIDSYLENGERVFCVRDNGVGFDMRFADKLFNVFQRLHRSEDYEGTGLGLAIAARIVHRHGGRIWAEGKPDEGATFYFTLGGAQEG
jgi:light-regulated signal transduction histidine kinase (bacteriophytochrome)